MKKAEDRGHSEDCQRTPKKEVRKLWGTCKAQHIGQVKNRILSFVDKIEDLSIFRNFKRRDGKDIWWFEISGNESVLTELESKWKHDYWKLEKVYSIQRSPFLENPAQETQRPT